MLTAVLSEVSGMTTGGSVEFSESKIQNLSYTVILIVFLDFIV